jgi:hypothetical protein
MVQPALKQHCLERQWGLLETLQSTRLGPMHENRELGREEQHLSTLGTVSPYRGHPCVLY